MYQNQILSRKPLFSMIRIFFVERSEATPSTASALLGFIRTSSFKRLADENTRAPKYVHRHSHKALFLRLHGTCPAIGRNHHKHNTIVVHLWALRKGVTARVLSPPSPLLLLSLSFLLLWEGGKTPVGSPFTITSSGTFRCVVTYITDLPQREGKRAPMRIPN